MERGVTAVVLSSACAAASAQERKPSQDQARAHTIARAQVWSRTDIPQMDMTRGPALPDGFAPGAMVVCDHLDKTLSGRSPKFACMFNKTDELKVKYGGTNGEVYGEVAASRLLWALGFGADAMYPVRVICHGCPRELAGLARNDGTFLFDPAVVERKTPGAEITPDGEEGWAWDELERIDEHAGGATVAERDALKLMAVLLQHTDTKPQQQRIICRADIEEGQA